jgi:hypothetical protein
MKSLSLALLLQIAGLLHLGLICAGALMPQAVHLREHLSPLPAFIRRLFWVYYVFIGLCLAGFGSLTVAFAPALASGAAPARAICVFLTLFWTLRLVAATFIFDVRPYLANPWLRLGYHATNAAFIYLPIVYALAAWKGGTP